MADNIQVTQGTGTTVAADDVGGVLWQRIKIGVGADGSATDVSSANPMPVTNDAIGTQADAAYSGTGNGTLVALLKKLSAQFGAGFTMSGSVSLADAEGIKGQFGQIVANPSQTFTRPADATPYTALDLVANSTTAGSVAFGTLAVARVAAGSCRINRLRLYTNHTTGLSGVSMRVRLWTAQPAYGAGDNGGYTVTSGAAGHLGSFSGAFEQLNDGALAILAPDTGPSLTLKLGSGQAVWWDLQTLTNFTPQSGKTFTCVAEVDQN